VGGRREEGRREEGEDDGKQGKTQTKKAKRESEGRGGWEAEIRWVEGWSGVHSEKVR
jgi:hypothetical protein